MHIQGKRVLITEGGTGIGLALAQALARKGARLVLSGRRPAPLTTAVAELKANGTEAYAVAADVAPWHEGEVEEIRLALSAINQHGQVVFDGWAVSCTRMLEE